MTVCGVRRRGDCLPDGRVEVLSILRFFFFSSRRRHTRSDRDWSSDVCSSDLRENLAAAARKARGSSTTCCPPQTVQLSTPTMAPPYQQPAAPFVSSARAPGHADRKSVV